MLVISIIAILISILLPALAGARKNATSLRELSAISQLGRAFAAYSNDNKSRVMPGYLRASWAVPGTVNQAREFWVWETDGDARDSSRLRGTPIRPYTWRMLPYVNFAWDALIVDKSLLADCRSRPNNPASDTGYQWALAFNPSFGMNTTYVGGDAHRGAFLRTSAERWGRFYVRRIDDVVFPDRLMTFASARGDRPGGNRNIILPGNHRIEGPWHATTTSDTAPDFIPWTAPLGKFKPELPPSTYGQLDFRNSGKAHAVHFDGHAQALSVDDSFDMRRWSNQANSSDWSP